MRFTQWVADIADRLTVDIEIVNWSTPLLEGLVGASKNYRFFCRQQRRHDCSSSVTDRQDRASSLQMLVGCSMTDVVKY